MRRIAIALVLLSACKSGRHEAKEGPPVVVVEGRDAVGAAAGPLVPEKEPNDQLAQAQPLTAPAGVQGKIDRPKDIDLFRLLVPAGDRQTLRAQVSGLPDLDLALDLLDQTGTRILGINDGKAGEPESISAITLSPGTYFLRVREAPGKAPPRADAEHTYALTWQLRAVDPAAEQEPNDKTALATPLAIGQDLTGQLAWRRDEDYYKLALVVPVVDGGAAPAGAAQPPQQIRVDVGGLDDVALTVQVLDSIGGKLIERRGGKGEPVTLRNLGVKAGEPFYYVVVRGSDRNLEGRYSLRVQPEQGLGAPSEQEPNDDKAHATPITPGAPMAGFLGPGDQDFYKLTLPGPHVLRVELSCPERINVKLALHDASGAELYHVDEGGRQEPEALVDAWVPAGDSYLRVYAGKGEANVDQPYRLEVRATPDDGTWEHEPNGTPARATPWPAGAGIMRGMIHPRGDEDYYRVPPPPASAKGIVASVRPIERVNLALVLTDEHGSVLARSQGAGEAERVLRTLIDPAHSYFLVVRDEHGKDKQSNPRDAYELHLGFE